MVSTVQSRQASDSIRIKIYDKFIPMPTLIKCIVEQCCNEKEGVGNWTLNEILRNGRI